VSQLVLMAAVLVLGVAGPGWPHDARWPLKAVAALLAFAGLLVVVGAARALGRGLTPFPRPHDAAELAETGPYAIVRHPIYSGGILFFAGISLALSPWALGTTVALAVFWALKARVEERFLGQRFPEYEAYCARTRYRLVPFLY